jgi:tetratricopeptide (TPR) repeat protein
LVPQSFIQNGDTTDFQIWLFAILSGLALFIFMELLEWGNTTEKSVPFSEQYPPVYPRFVPIRVGMIALCTVFTFHWSYVFAEQFQADVHHNLAIFFSKQAIWTREPRNDAKMANFPPDLREKYQAYGGALEHYKQVQKRHPAFPMAIYFTGNVYNDWGSQFISEAWQSRLRGDPAEESRLRDKGLMMWEQAEKAYEDTKKIAPNYVQVHHQMGLLYTKRGDQARQWGEHEQAQKYYDVALKNYYLYKQLDPVFPPNYERIVQILVMRNQLHEAQELYKQAIYYNDIIANSIVVGGRPERLGELGTNLAKLYFTEANQLSKDPMHPRLPQVDEALKYFEYATKNTPSYAEGWKGLGFLRSRMGDEKGAQEAMRKAHELNPNDPDLKFGSSAPH